MRTCIAIGALAVVALVLRALPAAEPFQATPQEGVLLLTNGQIIRGKITHAGDHYYVAFGEGEIRLRQNEEE